MKLQLQYKLVDKLQDIAELMNKNTEELRNEKDETKEHQNEFMRLNELGDAIGKYLEEQLDKKTIAIITNIFTYQYRWAFFQNQLL